MKKTLIFMFAIIASIGAKSQTNFTGTLYNPTNAITSSTVDTMYVDMPSSCNVLGFGLIKWTGTAITATAYLQGGSPASLVSGTTTFGWKTIDSTTIAAGALAMNYIEKANCTYTKFRLIVTGATSGSGTLKAWVSCRKYY